jgi:hypothetical protein
MGPVGDRKPLLSQVHKRNNEEVSRGGGVNDDGDESMAAKRDKSMHMRKATWINTSVILLALIMVRRQSRRPPPLHALLF